MNEEIKTIKYNDEKYPGILKRYELMPEILYCIGDLPDPDKKSVAIVGARGCSDYGRGEATRFATSLAAAGIQVISGMALGVDSAAHEGALKAGGRTFAVFGCGVDLCYPVSKGRLYERIIKNGGIISEYEPGTPALPHHFPVRNRIISGLSDAVLVIEARRRSGSLITANYAIEQGKTVYALPGRIRDSLSEGTNDLICQGAIPAVSPEQIIRDFGLNDETSTVDTALVERNLSDDEKRLLKCITSDPKTLEMLYKESRMPLVQVGSLLMRLQIDELVKETGPGWYVRK